MALHGLWFSVALLITAFLSMHLIHVTTAECPLDMSGSNFTLVASLCSNRDERAKCCRYINAFVALSIGRYANLTGNLGVPSESSEICLSTISRTLGLHGVPSNATAFCGFGTKILVNYGCMGRETVTQMTESPKFGDVAEDCEVLPLSDGENCRRCLNSEISYLRHLVGAEDNLTMSTCRDATFSALASRVNNDSAVDIANCFFGVSIYAPSVMSSPTTMPDSPPSPMAAESPNQSLTAAPIGQHHRRTYHLTLIPALGIAVTVFAIIMLVVLIFLIRRKSKELKHGENIDEASAKAFPPPLPPRSVRNLQDGPTSVFRKFSYKDIKKATEGFSTEIGRGGFGTVYRGQFSDGLLMGVKRMNIVSKQGEEEFCREIELLARLHHRHLVSLRGFCVDKKERFLLYEYMTNGSLKDHLYSPDKTPLSWQTRIQIAIDVANALEYLHFYCDPPLCHRDIKSSNILLDDKFVAKVADFGLAHASNTGSVSFEPVNTDVCGTPGYMDPEYTITQELTEKSDVYSYGVLLLEMVTGRGAVQDGLNLIEWSQIHSTPESSLTEIVDPTVRESLDLEQLLAMGSIVRWCTQKEGWSRPSIKQVLRLLYESSDPMDESGFAEAIEDEENEGRSSRRNGPTKGKVVNSGEARCLASSSSTSRSYCSRSFLLDNGNGSPQSPASNVLSI